VIFRVGDFELDEGTFELRRRGQPVSVQRRVLETIFHLVRHRDQVVTRDELCAGPWAGSIVSDTAIAQAIKHARRALGDRGDGQSVIRTVRGKGLRFVAPVQEDANGSPRETETRPWLKSAAPPFAFVGRGPELARLRAALQGAHAANGRVLLVAGEAGIGKTALVERMAGHAREHHVDTFWGHGWEAGGTPALWPWLELLRAIVESPTFLEFGSPPEGSTRWLDLVPELHKRFPQLVMPAEPFLDAEHARVRMFDSVTRFLTWVADHRDVLIVIEDLHAADRDSVALLRYAAPRIRASRLPILCTLRPDEFQSRNLSIQDVSDIEQIALEGLPATDVEALVRSTAPVLCEPHRIAQIHQLSAGNPLMIRELSAPFATPSDQPSGWVELSISDRWTRCLDRRIGGLPRDTQKLLEVAAIAGRTFELWLLASVSGLDERDALGRLRPAIEQRAVRPATELPGTHHFAHELFRDAFDRSLLPEERCELHARYGTALERDGHLDDDRVYRIAHHTWLASPLQRERAREWALHAARRARAAHTHDTECEQLAHAIQLGEALASGHDEVDLLLRLAEAQRLAGKRADAIATFDKAAALSQAARDTARFAAATIGHFDAAGETAPMDAALHEQVDQALFLVGEEDTADRAMLLAAKAFVLFLQPGSEAHDLWNEALRIARRCANPTAIGRVIYIGLRFCEDGRLLLPLANELVTAAKQVGQSGMLLNAHFTRCHALLEVGHRNAWNAEVAQYERLAQCVRDPTHMMITTLLPVVSMVLAGELGDAYTQARSIYVALEPMGDPILIPHFGCLLVSIWQAYGTSDHSERLLHELREVARQTLQMAPGFLAWRAMLISVENMLGNAEEATREFNRIAEFGYKCIKRDINYVPTLYILATVAAELGEREMVEELYNLLLPYAGLHATAMCGYFGPVNLSLALLKGALSDLTMASEHLRCALQDTESIEARPWIERIRRAIAQFAASTPHGACIA
jgi:DNA-binding winged helix-turn-helix (wHTH) protein